jgi:hypothetical protein
MLQTKYTLGPFTTDGTDVLGQHLTGAKESFISPSLQVFIRDNLSSGHEKRDVGPAAVVLGLERAS